MIGAHKVIVRNSRNRYEFTIKRNITVLCGDSGTGKTTLFDMVHECNRHGKASGVHISCDKRVFALDGGNDWKERLDRVSDSIVIIDEDNDFVLKHEFAKAIRDSDNYYILETRNYIPSLPYSVDEIYELSGKKNKKFQPVYEGVARMYDRPTRASLPFSPDIIITEDSGSGYQFFKNEADRIGIDCVSAGGKAKIRAELNKHKDKNVIVIADGAAFGAEIRDIVNQQKLAANRIAIFLPESFEWLVLRSGVVPVERIRVDQPEDYADSSEYLSWEQYFTAVLRAVTRDIDYMRYNKDEIADYYLSERTASRIREEMTGIQWENQS